jgi:hypothetical protein
LIRRKTENGNSTTPSLAVPGAAVYQVTASDVGNRFHEISRDRREGVSDEDVEQVERLLKNWVAPRELEH